ncbi:MAG: two-component regulator propeller domain-containing protein, partial [Termitinemataceae bacterium]
MNLQQNRKSSGVVVCLLLLFSSLQILPAQSYRFEHIDRTEGLPHSGVSALVQDSRGFLWIGTKNGFARYDGYSFVVYQRDPFDENSL